MHTLVSVNLILLAGVECTCPPYVSRRRFLQLFRKKSHTFPELKKSVNKNYLFVSTPNTALKRKLNSLEAESNLSLDRLGLKKQLSKRVWNLINREIHPNLVTDQQVVDEDEVKNNFINMLRIWNASIEPQTKGASYSKRKSSYGIDHIDTSNNNSLKHKVRRQIWQWSKITLKNNEEWSDALAKNKIDIDNINIDRVDLSLINVDNLGIQSKILKRTAAWLLK